MADLRRDTKTRLLVVSIVVVGLVWIVGFGFDRLLARDGVTRTEILVISHGLTAVVAGFLFYSLAYNERMRRAIIQQRLGIISEMNHHIRNALQIITYATATRKPDESVELIRSSVDRIEWALREVLPADTPAPVPPAEAGHSPEHITVNH